MTQQAKMRALFLSVIALLLLCATTTYLSFFYFRDGERWVTHTQEVRAAVGDTEAALAGAARARMNFLMSGSRDDLREFRTASSNSLDELKKFQDLTKDNRI